MNFLLASAIGVLAACGAWLVLRARTYGVVLGIMLLGYAANLLLLAMGRLGAAAPPIVAEGTTGHADPVPQALVLTAIVIGFGMAAYVVVLAIRARAATGTDHVDGAEPDDEAERAPVLPAGGAPPETR